MTDSRAALGSDRLPWLPDEPRDKPVRRHSLSAELAVPAAGLLLLVAGASYWVGTRSHHQPAPAISGQGSSVVTPLPRARTEVPSEEVAIAPQPQINPAPASEVRSVAQRELPLERPRAIRRVVVENPAAPPPEVPESGTKSAPVAAAPGAPAAAKAPVNPDSKPLRAWPAWRSQGADGRIVRIGAFGTREQAKLGWRYMVRAYPAVAHLKATVVADRNSRGRRFYRFQIGTTSQAHSEVLCQRMDRIHLSCAVVGLPWQPKGVER